MNHLPSPNKPPCASYPCNPGLCRTKCFGLQRRFKLQPLRRYSGILVFRDQEARRGITILLGITGPNQQEKVGLLLYNGDREEWNMCEAQVTQLGAFWYSYAQLQLWLDECSNAVWGRYGYQRLRPLRNEGFGHATKKAEVAVESKGNLNGEWKRETSASCSPKTNCSSGGFSLFCWPLSSEFPLRALKELLLPMYV